MRAFSANSFEKLINVPKGETIAHGTPVSVIDTVTTEASGTQLATAINAIIAALEEFGITEEE
jgi:hypothetical protein